MLTPDQLFAPFWQAFRPFALLMAFLLLGAFVYFLLKRRWLAAAGIPEIARMTGKDFESKMALVFQRKGYRVEQTPYAGDWGADLVLSKDGQRTVVQVKRWTRRVSPKAVQEVVAAKAKYACERAMVVTNSFFTEAATELARVNKVELWDRDRLVRELLAHQSAIPAALADLVPAQAAPGASAPPRPKTPAPVASSVATQQAPRCYKCGREMVLKENARGKFWACPGFPKCRNTFPARQ
jgi:restriction system protein